MTTEFPQKIIRHPITPQLLVSLLIITSGINIFLPPVSADTPHPLFGRAVYCDGTDANGAIVNISSPLGYKITYVGPAGGWESGYWMVDVGFPTPWPTGTPFTVTITETGTNKSGSITGIIEDPVNDVGTITISPPLNIQLNTPATGVSGNPLQFNASATGGCPPYNYEWDFGDGNTSQEQNPTHTYTNFGIFTINLTIHDETGKSATATTTITIYSPPLANFTYHPQHPQKLETVYFNDTSIDLDGVITTWQWNFGDGNTSTEQNPTHQYTNNGTFTITLTVTDNNGIIRNTSKMIIIGGTALFHLSQKWNFISIPFNQSISKTDLIVKYDRYYLNWTQATTNNNPLNTPIINNYIFGWNPIGQTYIFANTIEPSQGYWVFSNYPCEIWATDFTIPQDDSLITTLKPKWNMIGNPHNESINKINLTITHLSTDYTWSDAVAAGIISDYIFGWTTPNQSYTFSNVLSPEQSYWMYAYQECIIKENIP